MYPSEALVHSASGSPSRSSAERRRSKLSAPARRRGGDKPRLMGSISVGSIQAPRRLPPARGRVVQQKTTGGSGNSEPEPPLLGGGSGSEFSTSTRRTRSLQVLRVLRVRADGLAAALDRPDDRHQLLGDQPFGGS